MSFLVRFLAKSGTLTLLVNSAIPESALYEEQHEDDDDEPQGEDRDDEKTGTRYNVCHLSFLSTSCCRSLLILPGFQYSWFHIIFAGGAMYVAMLLTDWFVYALPKDLNRLFPLSEV